MQLQEFCSLSHERQIIRIELPITEGSEGFLRGQETGALYPFQRSAEQPDQVFLEVALGPLEKITLQGGIGGREPVDLPDRVTFRPQAAWTGVIANEVFSVEVPFGESGFDLEATEEPPGPLHRFRIGDGPWRGRTFLDVRRGIRSWRGDLLEQGPLRTVYRFRAEVGQLNFYEAILTVDAGQPMLVVEERFETGSGDQVVWDFVGNDLPEEFYLLDASASYQTRPLFYEFDQRLTRVCCWTQQSQHFDFSDGFALGFSSHANPTRARDVAGFIALEGGTWRGGKLNHLEAWTRRWFPGDAASRRNVPSEAKADGQPNPERIPARGRPLCEPHFNAEGWIGRGARKWALVLTTFDRIEPLDRSTPALGHFEDVPDRPRYRSQQSLLRKIHTQRGILPLQDLVNLEFTWETEGGEPSEFVYPNEVLDRHFPGAPPPTEARRAMIDYLAARVYGFWEGSGSAYTNPVVSRRVAPEMFRYEWLVRQGALSGDEQNTVRAWFAFLLHVFASDHYYPGDASMLPVDSRESLDPTLAGMANQNFYTDVFNVPGTGAQVFWKHPRATAWCDFFACQWHRQLAYHMYPESGVWEESHTYYHHVLHTVLPTLLRRRADGVFDEFANPYFQKFIGAEICQLTPRDTYFGDCRHVVIFGDHAVQVELYRDLWRECAVAIEPHRPDLAQNLAWVYREMNGTRPLCVQARAPELRNEHVQGLGVMFRGTDTTGQESLLALRSGNAWAHHHNDDGSIQFYARGRAMVVDAAFGTDQSDSRRKYEAVGHSRWMPLHADPVNHLWRFNRGWITSCALEGPLAFATSYSPILLVRTPTGLAIPARVAGGHFRTVVQLSPAAYLILDAVEAGREGKIVFHVPADGHANTEAATGDVKFTGDAKLHVISLDHNAPSRTVVDRPKAAEKRRFTTLALEYDVETRDEISAFLVAVQSSGLATPSGVKTDNGWLIQSEEIDVRLQRESVRQWQVVDQRTQVVRQIDPRRF